jgi:hypothetical protein
LNKYTTVIALSYRVNVRHSSLNMESFKPGITFAFFERIQRLQGRMIGGIFIRCCQA